MTAVRQGVRGDDSTYVEMENLSVCVGVMVTEV